VDVCDTYLQKEYELRLAYLTNHLSRMWSRFNFFLTINTALFAVVIGSSSLKLILFGGIFGVVMSLMWNQFSATDNYLVEVYRHQVEHAHYLLNTQCEDLACLYRRPPAELETWSFTGKVSDQYFDPEDRKVKSIPQGIFQRRSQRVSATELGVVLSSLYAIAWIGFLLISFMPPWFVQLLKVVRFH